MVIRAQLAALCLLAGAAEADAPLSAIPWLSESIAGPAGTGLVTPPPGDLALSAAPPPVTVRPLETSDPGALGLMSADEAGLPPDLWRDMDRGAILEAIALDLGTAPLALRDLHRRILVAEPDLPDGMDGGSAMLIARVDALIRMAHLRDAAALLHKTGPTGDAARHRRAFDIAVLAGLQVSPCAVLGGAAEVTFSLPARIFCLARRGDWPAAAVTLDAAHALDAVDPAMDALLLRFLDDHAENEADLPPPDSPTPLDFALFEAIGQPLATSGLPLAFAHADLAGTTGWKARVTAAERLARTGAIDAEDLWAIYAEGEAAASGGVWARVRAASAFRAALDAGTAAPEATRTLWDALRSAGLAAPLAPLLHAHLEGRAPGDAAAGATSAIALLAGEVPGEAETFADSLAAGTPDAGRAASDLERTIAAAWTPGAAGSPNLFAAMADVAAGADGNPVALERGLAGLIAAGVGDTARMTALQLLLAEPPR